MQQSIHLVGAVRERQHAIIVDVHVHDVPEIACRLTGDEAARKGRHETKAKLTYGSLTKRAISQRGNGHIVTRIGRKQWHRDGVHPTASIAAHPMGLIRGRERKREREIVGATGHG